MIVAGWISSFLLLFIGGVFLFRTGSVAGALVGRKGGTETEKEQLGKQLAVAIALIIVAWLVRP